MGTRRRQSLALLVAALFAPGAVASDVFPIADLRPGMKGVGRTVFEGNRIDEFQVEVLGVLENAVGPKQSMVLARLSGGPLANTGVIAGMSGSPVFIDGRLLGAVSYGFPFSKETIAGITPIGEMVEATRTSAPRAAATRFPVSAEGLRLPLDREAFVAAVQRRLPAVGAGAGGPRGAALQPLALPLVFSGFDPATFEWARGVFSGLGFLPVMGGGSGALPEAQPALAPGAAVGVSLVEGDLDLSVSGTITDIDGDRVYAFGHPFYNLGPTQFPMKKAYVYSVLPSLYQSLKLAGSGEPVGTMDQDRTTAIAGRLGRAPRMIPVAVKITTSRGQERSYAFRMVEDELFSPVLAYMSLLSVLQANERAFGTSTVRVEARVALAGGRTVRLEDLFTEQQPALQAATLVAAPLAFLMANDFERVAVERLEVSVASYETTQSAQIERAWIERSGPLKPGTTVPVKLLLRSYRGQTLSETLPLTIPRAAPAGSYTLLVTDGATLTALEQREMRQAFVPRDLDQLIRAINGLRRNDRIYARLLRADEGAVVAGEYLQSLPPSVLSVLGTPGEGAGVVPVRTSSLWDLDLPVDYAVSGSRSLALSVQR